MDDDKFTGWFLITTICAMLLIVGISFIAQAKVAEACIKSGQQWNGDSCISVSHK